MIVPGEAQSTFLELHGMLGTAQMGRQYLDALFQMPRRPSGGMGSESAPC
jgi:hypothetical protein